jgi:hypothetical protein
MVNHSLLESYSLNECIKGAVPFVDHHQYHAISRALLRLDPSLTPVVL